MLYCVFVDVRIKPCNICATWKRGVGHENLTQNKLIAMNIYNLIELALRDFEKAILPFKYRIPFLVTLPSYKGAMNAINCCTVLDCAQEECDRTDTQHYTTTDMSQAYWREPWSKSTISLVSPCCSPNTDNEMTRFYSQKHGQFSYEDSSFTDSLSGPVETTYDEADQIEADYEKCFPDNRNTDMTALRNSHKKSMTDLDDSGVSLRSILTRRDENFKMRANRMEDYSDSSISYNVHPPGRATTNIRSQKDYWKEF